MSGTTSGLLFYDSTTGRIVTGGVIDGRFTVAADVGGTTQGWTHIVGASRSLFFYRAGDGIAASGFINEQGVFVQPDGTATTFANGWAMFPGTRSGRYPWLKGTSLSPSLLTDDGKRGGGCFVQTTSGPWTHVVGAGFNAFLLYNAGTGAARAARIDDTGPCASGAREYGWTLLDTHAFASGWTHAAGTFAGRVVFYRASDGFGGSGFLNTDGVWTQTGNPSFGAGWTHVVGGGSRSLLFYNANTGKGLGGILDADGVWVPTTNYV